MAGASGALPCQWGRRTADGGRRVAGGGLESSTVDGSVTLFAGSAMASHGVCQSQLESQAHGPELGRFVFTYSGVSD